MKIGVEKGAVKSMDRLLTAEQVAELLGLTKRCLANWRYRGGGPKYLKIGHKTVRYRYSDLMRWLEDRKFSNSSEEMV